MRLRFLSSAVVLGLVACHGSPVAEQTPGLPGGSLAALRGTWLLVPEASHADTLAYRRNTYRFKYRPGGRPGFRLGPNGRFTRFDLAEDGGLVAHDGTWAETTSGRLLIQLPGLDPAEPDYELALLDFRQGQLRLRRLADRPAVEVMRKPK